MLQGEHSAIHLTFIKLPFVIKVFVLFIFRLPLKTGFSVIVNFVSKLTSLLVSGQFRGDHQTHLSFSGQASTKHLNHLYILETPVQVLW